MHCEVRMCSAVAERLCVQRQAAAPVKTEVTPTSTGASKSSRGEQAHVKDPSNPEWCFANGKLSLSPPCSQSPPVFDALLGSGNACACSPLCVARQATARRGYRRLHRMYPYRWVPPVPIPPSHRHLVLFSVRLGCTCIAVIVTGGSWRPEETCSFW